MNSVAKKKYCAILCVIMTAALALGLLTMFRPANAANPIGLGDVRFSWERTIGDGITLGHIMSDNDKGEQKTYTISFDPQKAAVEPVIANGGNVMYGSTMSSLVDFEERRGRHIVFGVNGDVYDTSNGVTIGLTITDGRLINSATSQYSFGLTPSGDIVYGDSALEMSVTIGDQTYPITQVNKERKLDKSGLYLLTEDFNSTTKSTQSGAEVVFDVSDENAEGLKIGVPMKATLESVNLVDDNQDGNLTRIDAGKIVLAAHSESQYYDVLQSISPSAEITVNVNDKAGDKVDWSTVQSAMGIFHLLLDNGSVPAGIWNNTEVHPRTAMGLKEDGSIVLLQTDGRQTGWSNGLTFRQIIEHMRDELGCVTIFNFDGGGSSTIAATLPGDEKATVLNSPSDGQERANTNALLFIATDEKPAEPSAEMLHVYPVAERGYGTKSMLLEGAKMQFEVKATDSNYFAADVPSVSWTVEGDIGTIEEDGTFTAKNGSGTGYVVATSGSMTTKFEADVVDGITEIVTKRTIVSVAPGATTQLSFEAYNNGVPVACTAEALQFRMEPSALGTVSADGTFTASQKQGTGTLYVSYKDYTLELPVEVGKMPYSISDFETDIVEDGKARKNYLSGTAHFESSYHYEGATEDGWRANYILGSRGGSGTVSINRDEKYIKSGDGSLKIEYDFATKPLTGTVAIEWFNENDYDDETDDGTVLPGQPTAVGCWVYGDGNGAWLRIQMTGGKYVGDTYVDWVGWRYIETAIPTDAPYPYNLIRAVRVLGTASIANHTKGCIYVDSLRAIYDFRNDDETPTRVYDVKPQDITTSNRQEVISFKVADPKTNDAGESVAYTGVATERTKMWINNVEYTNLQQSVDADGTVTVTYNPSALTRLRPGLQRVKVRTEDNFGNKTFTEFSFTVSGYAVQLEQHVADADTLYAGQQFTYGLDAQDYKNFMRAEIEIVYNADNLTLVGEPQIDARLTEEERSVSDGRIVLTLCGMDALSAPEEDMILLTFRVNETVKGSTGIEIVKALVKDSTDNSIGVDTELILDPYDIPLDYKYLVNVSGTTVGDVTEITVTEGGTVVSDVTLVVEQSTGGAYSPADAEYTISDEGTFVFPELMLNTGVKYRIRAEKDGFVSNLVETQTYASYGRAVPDRVSVTVGEDAARGAGISWMTSYDAQAGYVLYSADAAMKNPVRVDAASEKIAGVLNEVERKFLGWGAYLTGLEPDTVYYYTVGDAASRSAVKSFKTAPDGDITIAVYGDIQGGSGKFPEIIGRLESLVSPDLSLLAGDVSDSGQSVAEWDTIYDNLAPWLTTGLWASTIGNHDTPYDGKEFTSLFYGADNGTGGQSRRNYYFTAGDALIFNFDTEAGYESYDAGYEKQIALMRKVFAETDKSFKIVLMHRSAYPMNYNEPEIRALAPVFEECGVDLVLSGHDHIYSRTTMLAGEKTVMNTNGVTYVVTGSASGSKYYAAANGRPWEDFVYDDDYPVFSYLTIENGVLSYIVYAFEDGQSKKIDEVVLNADSDLSIEKTGEGTISYDYVKQGVECTLTFLPAENFGVRNVWVNGEKVTLAEGNTYTFVPGETVTVRAEFSEGGTWLSGNGAPEADRGSWGDLYLDADTCDVYRKTDDGWQKIGNIKGEQGEQGEPGEKGEQGEQGEPGEKGETEVSGGCGSSVASAGSVVLCLLAFGTAIAVICVRPKRNR